MRKLVLLTSKRNRYYRRFKEESRQAGLQFAGYWYEDFSLDENSRVCYQGESWVGFDEREVVILRDGGYYYDEEIGFWARALAWQAERAGAKVADGEWWRLFPWSVDKYRQALEFGVKGVPHVTTWLLNEWWKNGERELPVIVKPRVGAGGRGIVVIERMEDREKLKGARLDKYVVQPLRELVRDVRVLLVGGRILGAVEREVKRSGVGLGVKVRRQVELTKEEEKLAEMFLKDDEVFIRGLDLLTDREGRSWVGEMNIAPIFDAFERETGVNVVREVVRSLV